MLHPRVEIALSEINVKFFFTDAREFKEQGNEEMFKLAVAHIFRHKREMNENRRLAKRIESGELTFENGRIALRKDNPSVEQLLQELKSSDNYLMSNPLQEEYESVFDR